MAFRFFRRIKVAPGITVNLSKSGPSLSVGPRGAKMTVGRKGIRRTVGVPGTGLYYTKHTGYGRKNNNQPPSYAPLESLDSNKLELGFFKRLVTPDNERQFIEGLRLSVAGQEAQALAALQASAELADAAFWGGLLALKLEQFETSIQLLNKALSQSQDLGQLFDKYGINAAVTLPITEHLQAVIIPAVRGINLVLAEAWQGLEQPQQALDRLALIYAEDADPVVVLSMAEILAEDMGQPADLQRVVEITAGIKNTDAISAGICFWRGCALRRLGLLTAARDALTMAFRRKANRDAAFLLAVQYERAQVYGELGQASRQRQELEKIYAQQPDFLDVAEQLQKLGVL